MTSHAEATIIDNSRGLPKRLSKPARSLLRLAKRIRAINRRFESNVIHSLGNDSLSLVSFAKRGGNGLAVTADQDRTWHVRSLSGWAYPIRPALAFDITIDTLEAPPEPSCGLPLSVIAKYGLVKTNDPDLIEQRTLMLARRIIIGQLKEKFGKVPGDCLRRVAQASESDLLDLGQRLVIENQLSGVFLPQTARSRKDERHDGDA